MQECVRVWEGPSVCAGTVVLRAASGRVCGHGGASGSRTLLAHVGVCKGALVWVCSACELLLVTGSAAVRAQHQ